MFGETIIPNLWPHVYLHHTTILIFLLLFVFFQRLPLNRVPSRFWVISHMLWQWADLVIFVCKRFGRDGQKEWQGWLWDHGGWRRGRVSHWPRHHNKISDDQLRAVSAGGSRSARFTSLSHLIFLSAIIHCLSPCQRSVYVRTGWDLPDQNESASLERTQTVPEYLWESKKMYRCGWKEGFPNKSLGAHTVYWRVAPVPSQRCPNSGWFRCARWHRSKGKQVWANRDAS